MNSIYSNKSIKARSPSDTSLLNPTFYSSTNNYKGLNVNSEESKNCLEPFHSNHYTLTRSMKFVNEKIIGTGSSATIIKAETESTGEVVAIKRLVKSKKFKHRELEILQMMNHINIVKLKHWFTTQEDGDEDIYLNLVMEFIPDTVYRLMKSYQKQLQPFPTNLIKLYSYQIFKGIIYIHSFNICHRDLKPQNLLINQDIGLLKICDFGSAKRFLTGEMSVSYICSRYYRAPELMLGATNYTTAVDLWSIGCIIAELYLGRPIFAGENNTKQFGEIMKILGTPSGDDIIAMNQKSTDLKLPTVKSKDWKKIFGMNTHPQAIDLISKLLVYNPDHRMKPLEALCHPFFDEIREEGFEINGKKLHEDLFEFTEELSLYPGLAHRLIPSWMKSRKTTVDLDN